MDGGELSYREESEHEACSEDDRPAVPADAQVQAQGDSSDRVGQRSERWPGRDLPTGDARRADRSATVPARMGHARESLSALRCYGWSDKRDRARSLRIGRERTSGYRVSGDADASSELLVYHQNDPEKRSTQATGRSGSCARGHRPSLDRSRFRMAYPTCSVIVFPCTPEIFTFRPPALHSSSNSCSGEIARPLPHRRSGQ